VRASDGFDVGSSDGDDAIKGTDVEVSSLVRLWVELIIDLRVGMTVGKGLCKKDDGAVLE
jgi:hypothetical protein